MFIVSVVAKRSDLLIIIVLAGSMTVLVAVLVELTTVEKLPKAMALYQLLSIVGWGGGAPLAGKMETQRGFQILVAFAGIRPKHAKGS